MSTPLHPLDTPEIKKIAEEHGPTAALSVAKLAAVAGPDHHARAHHKFSMSKLNYLDPSVGGCRGYRGRDGSSAAAEEGTQLHEIAEEVLRDYLRAVRKGVTLAQFAAARRAWDDDAHVLLHQCFAFLDEEVLRPGVKVYIELKARVRKNDGTEVNYGHLDLFALFPDGRAKLIDWKFGYVPVVPAEKNRQGLGYGAAMFQLFPSAKSIEVIFVQPRLRWVSRHTYSRERAEEMAFRVGQIVQGAIDVQGEDMQRPLVAELLNPGAACEWCARVGGCPGYLREYRLAVARMGAPAAVATTIDVDAIDTPEKAAIARAWVDFVELASGPIKKRAEEIARANGGRVFVTMPSGEVVQYDMASRALNRELGSAVEIAEALKDFVAPMQLLGAAKLGLEKTLDIVAPALLELQPEVGTKKAAREAIVSLLESQGLVTRPDGKVEFLKRTKTHRSIEDSKQ
jgi:hypothetical protein